MKLPCVRLTPKTRLPDVMALHKIHFPLLLICVSAVLFASGCIGPEKTPKPDNLIEEDTYIDLLIEMQHITTYRNAQPDSVNADSLKAIVYRDYGVTEEQFLTSHEYYQHDVEGHISRIDQAIQRIEDEKQLIESYMDSIKTEQAKHDSLALPDSAR